jgi:stringent starvation protein B
MTSNKPYLVRAIYQWLLDNKQTPYVMVACNFPGVEVPKDYIKNDTIVLNISPEACSNFLSNNHCIRFAASFSGEVYNIEFSPEAVMAIYSHETGEGMRFEVNFKLSDNAAVLGSAASGRSGLRLVEK